MSAKWVGIVVVATLAGCGWRQQHLSGDYGKSFDAIFAAQAVERQTPARAASGLDSQEASIIAQTYRKSLAPKEVSAKEQPILMVAPTREGQAQPLAPSVPKER